MDFKSFNPYTLSTHGSFENHRQKELDKMVKQARKTFSAWSMVPVSERVKPLSMVISELKKRREEFAQTITLEMGKPILESRLEVDKCITACTYYIEHAEELLADQQLPGPGSTNYISFAPVGGVLGIMPWNFPFWQVFRFAIPTIVCGNVVLCKHAPNVPLCAQLIEEVFKTAFKKNKVYQNLYISEKKVAALIANPFIQGVSLTGSVKAGKAVAQVAGKHLKRVVLELGGSNAFLVFADADIPKTVKSAIRGRYGNAGQSCIAAKRFIVHEKIYDEFLNAFALEIMKLKTGDPTEETTQIGPLARPDLAATLEKQVTKSVNKGAEVILGGTRENCFYAPTLLSNVVPGMPAFDEEIFGPVAAITKAGSDGEMINLANQSEFGLGVNLFSENTSYMQTLVPHFNEGAVFINDVVRSDARLPFGGVKRSGIGRELGAEGIRSFVNIKTVVLA